MNRELLEKVCHTPGIPGYEDAVVEAVEVGDVITFAAASGDRWQRHRRRDRRVGHSAYQSRRLEHDDWCASALHALDGPTVPQG